MSNSPVFGDGGLIDLDGSTSSGGFVVGPGSDPEAVLEMIGGSLTAPKTEDVVRKSTNPDCPYCHGFDYVIQFFAGRPPITKVCEHRSA
jgi:hypothetical protein